MAGIDGVAKLLYIMVVDDDEEMNSLMGRKDLPGFRYTRPVLHSTLQFIGCKARHAFKVSQRVFEMMKSGYDLEKLASDFSEDTDLHPKRETWRHYSAFSNEDSLKSCLVEDDTKSKSFEVYKRRTTLVVSRNKFLDVVCEALSEYKYLGPNQRSDLVLACRIRERKESVTVLLCGASGCGKSTLSALLGCRLGVTTIISTDSIRHMMRSFVDEVDNPLLWASTYHAGECLDPSAVAEAKARRRAKKSSGLSSTSPAKDESLSSTEAGKSETCANTADLISSKQMAVEGFKAQSEMVIDSLDRLITAWEERKESVVVEGVHLSLNFVMGLMKKHPSIIPFMIYIANEDKHLERFAVRAKYMTLDPARNKYVKYIRNIRTIQEYLCKQADKHLVPKVNNTNVDKSVAAIHATIFSCLRRRETGEHLYDPVTNTASIVDEEYRNQCSANSLNSKGMLQLIQRQGSSRHLMALLNHDGSVVKAWPVDNITVNGSTVLGRSDMNGIGAPVYGPLKISKAEPVNLQFGRFGISAWPDDTGGTSYASSINELRGELTDNGSKYFSSCCSSPRFSDAPAKEPKEEFSVHGSDDEIDEPLESDSDEDRRDGELHLQHESEGSVDEEFTKSDEEYDDLAMQDVPKSGYATDNDDDEIKRTPNSNPDPPFPSQNGFTREPLKQDADEVSASRCKPISESTLMHAFSGPLRVKNEKVANAGNHLRFRKRSLSIPTLR